MGLPSSVSTGSRAIWFVLPFVITITTECAGHFGCCSAFVIDIIIEELGSIHIEVSFLSMLYFTATILTLVTAFILVNP